MPLPFTPPGLVRLQEVLRGRLPASVRWEEMGLAVGNGLALLLLPLAFVLDPSPRLGEASVRWVGSSRHVTFPIVLQTGELLAVDVEQQGVDVALSLRDPFGVLHGPVDSPFGGRGSETLRAVARGPGLHRLEIEIVSARLPAGSWYRLRVRRVRQPAARDRRWVEAQELALRATALASKDPLAARGVFLHAAERFAAAGDRKQWAVVLFSAGELTGAERHVARACYLAAERDMPAEGRALLFYQLGALERDFGRLDEAQAHLEASARWGAILGDRRLEGWAWARIGGLHLHRSRYQLAFDAYARWLEVGPSGETPAERFDILLNLAKVLRALRQSVRARHFSSLALELSRRSSLPGKEAEALTELGALAPSPAEAEALFLRARDLSRDRPEVLARCLLEWGVRRMDDGPPAAARPLFEEAKRLARETGLREVEINLTANLAHLSDLEGDGEAALEGFGRALRHYFYDRRLVGAGLSLFYGRAQAWRRLGRLTEARRDIERAIQIAEVLRLEPGSPELRASFFQSAQDSYDFYIDLLMQQGQVSRAFEVSEQTRARTLLEELSSFHKQTSVPAGLLARREDLKRQIEQAHLAGEMNWSPSARSAPPGGSRIDDLFASYLQVEAEIRRSDAGSANLLAARPASLAEIQAALDEDTVFLVYSLGKDRSYAWVIGPRDLRGATLAPRARIEALARAAYRQLEARPPPGPGSRDLLQAAAPLGLLSRELLAPVSREIRGKRLVIVADGALHLLPFAALPLPGDGRPAVALHEVVMAPSASVALLLRDRGLSRRWPPQSIALLADPVYGFSDSRMTRFGRRRVETASPFSRSFAEATRDAGLEGFTRLPFAGREGEEIAALFPDPRQVFKAFGLQASRQTVTRPELARYDALHIASHAFSSADRPHLSGIVLSLLDERGQWQDGFLRAFEVYGLRLPNSLVVLSGCQTGLGAEVEGEGILGLVRGFFYAGSPRVMASLWNVDDESTALLMRKLYQEVMREQSPAGAALAKAQRELLGDPRWSDPHFWAGIVLAGSWR